MTLTLTTGCICYAFELDGKPLHECNPLELQAMLLLAAQKIASKHLEADERSGCIISILQSMVESFPDTYESTTEPCECCGDYVETYTMEL